MNAKSTIQRVINDEQGDHANSFFVLANGQVELGNFPGIDQLYVKYDFTYGPNWTIVQGIDKGISQIASKAEGSNNNVVWNFPLDIVFKSSTAYGWPRLVISVFGLDMLGRDVVRGYGSLHLPTQAGRYSKTVRMFRPSPNSVLTKFINWVKGTPPEYFDSRFVSRSEGREVTMVQSSGLVQVQVNILTRGMNQLGYQDGKIFQVQHSTAQDEDVENKVDN